MKKNILFLCTGNSCRSQMAEGWAKNIATQHAHFYSAGIETHGLNPRAVQVMQEAGIDISNHRSNTLDEIEDNIDIIISVCDHAKQTCPTLPGIQHIHIPFDDPPGISKTIADEEKVLEVYRRVRDEIQTTLKNRLPEIIEAY